MVPASARSFDEGLVHANRVYLAAVDQLAEQFGERWLTADEGGLSPPVEKGEELLSCAVDAIERAGLVPGKDVCLAIDVASSHFFREGTYFYEGRELDSDEMIGLLEGLVSRFPLVSVEDGLAEDDWAHWPDLNRRLNSNCLVLGDDLLCTNPGRIERAIQLEACNALLLKVNQIGTLSEALQAYRMARQAGWQVTISVRSGDTEDDWYSDLVIGWNGDQTKAGSITQSERLSKYNRLLAIEKSRPLPVRSWPLNP
jgi:enolase